MKPEIKVAASILAADFTALKEEVKKIESAGCDIIHIDVMDGHFVPNITIGPVIIKAVRGITKLPIDSHLMIENPDMYIEDFVKCGSDIITVHVECLGKRTSESKGFGKFPKEVESMNVDKARALLKKIRGLGARPAISLNPGTPLCIQDILADLDKVLIMSVNPGFAGQEFISSVIPKIRDLRKIYTKDIEVDGGINDKTGQLVVSAGANILATASYFFKAKDPAAVVKKLKSLGR